MFSNIGSDANIDWASLAQQWIQRNTKETINETFDTIEAPPPPNISQSYYEKRARNYAGYDEKGEADMDMDEDEMVPPAPPMMPTSPDDVNIMQFPLHAVAGDDGICQRADASAWNTWMNPMNPLSQQLSKSNPTAHIPSLMKISIPNPNDLIKIEDNTTENKSTTIDAAKRKVLPAWIREGLEKMEREKQKQLEREQQMKERGGEKPAATSPDAQLAIDITVKDHVKTLESGDSSGNEQDDDDLPTYKLKNTNKSKHIGNIETTIATSSGVSNNDNDNNDDEDDDADAPASFIGKSYEQRLADLMIAVRVNLTQLLLEVTNDEIAQIAKETLKSSKLKASSAQVIRKSALSSITNRLGLAAYSSSGDESDDSNNSATSDNETSRDEHRRRVGGGTSTTAEDSEEEIRAKLRVRRRAFAKTTEEIEESIAMSAAREEQKLRYYKQKEQQQKQTNESNEHKDTMMAVSSSTFSGIGKNNARDFGETTTESKLQQSNGKKSKERGLRRGERATRFSDNKDSKNVVAVNASYMSQFNSAAATATTTAAIAPVVSNSIHGFQMATSSSSSLTDANTNIHNLYAPPPTAAAAAGINSVLSAAEAALEKAAKRKNSASTSSSRSKSIDTRERDIRRRRREQRRQHSSDDSDDSSSTSNDSTDSSSSSTDTSRDSKYSRVSSNSTSRNKRSSHSSSRYHERYEDQRRNYHKRRNRDDYDDRTRSRYSTSSSKHASRHRERSRDRSRSRSTYSSSSSKRHHTRH